MIYLASVSSLGIQLACSRLSDSGEDAKEKSMRKVGRAGKRKRGETACSYFFYNSLPPTFGTFEIIRCQTVEMSMSRNLSKISHKIISHSANPLSECEQSGV